jgi:hypothetical protein
VSHRNTGVLPWSIILISCAIFTFFNLLILAGLTTDVSIPPEDLSESTAPPLLFDAASVLFGYGRYPGPPDLISRCTDILLPGRSTQDRLIKRPAVWVSLALKYSETDLLCHVLNHVNFTTVPGKQAIGFAEASLVYFDLKPQDLSAGEICLLLEMAFHPQSVHTQEPEALLEIRQNRLLRLHRRGILSADRFREELALPLAFVEDHIPVL